jgi:hypothetical protein
MNAPDSSRYDDFSRANCLKKGALFGFAIGMLVGMFWVGIAPPEGGELASLSRFKDVIIAGIALGVVIGLLWPKPIAPKSVTEDKAANQPLNTEN